MTKIAQSITECIGNTPIVQLHRIVPEQAADVFVKLEFFNPGGSVKDRIALSMIEAAEKAGKLALGDTIIEPTSGNTGIGLALVGAAKGYKVIIVMPETMSVERRQLIQAYGATILLTPGEKGMKGAIEKATELAQEAHMFMPMQFNNAANPSVHEKTTAKEMIDAFGPTELDVFVAGVGTGGTITGVGHELKRVHPDVQIYAVEPAESPVLEGGQAGPHKIQGLGAGFVPEVLDIRAYDQVIAVTSEEAIQTARELALKEGILGGFSSGAAVHAAIKVAQQLGKGKKVLTIVPDNGERYLSTPLYQLENQQ